MAKLMVEIDINNVDYEQLVHEVVKKPRDYCWFSVEDGAGEVLVDEAYLRRSKVDDSFYAFKLIGVKP